MVHIVFNDEDAKVLEQAILMDETLSGNIIVINDDFSVCHDIV